MIEPPPRIATLVLVDRDGALLGQLPRFEASTPWWMDVGPVVRATRERFGLDVTVLRLLTSERPSAHGGAVTYLAELDDPASVTARLPDVLEPWSGDLRDDPLRLPWARPGGPAADLAWAATTLAERGMPVNGAPEQIRTWNLSSLWRLPTTGGDVWLKVVPPFFAHEGAILERLAGAPVPELLGHDGPRVLLAHIAGQDQYDAPRPVLDAIVDILIDVQTPWLGRSDELLALGLPDWRATALTEAIADLVDRAGRRVPDSDRPELEALVESLPERFERIGDCGLGDGLVHGDCHPGNVRGEGATLVLLDWGDCGVGHPLLDLPGFLDRIAADNVAAIRDRWLRRWRDLVPRADPERAARLMAPVAAARQALIFQRFLDGIEPSEHPYHQADVPDWLRRTAAIVRAEDEAGAR